MMVAQVMIILIDLANLVARNLTPVNSSLSLKIISNSGFGFGFLRKLTKMSDEKSPRTIIKRFEKTKTWFYESVKFTSTKEQP